MTDTTHSTRRTIVSPKNAAKQDLADQIREYQENLPLDSLKSRKFPGNHIPDDIAQQGTQETLAHLDGMATLYMDEFKDTVWALARAVGAKGRDTIAFGDQKNLGNILKKANADYGGDMGQVRDVLRATIYVDDIGQVIKACTMLFQDDRFVCGKDQFRKPNEHGVRNAIGIWRINDDKDQPFHAEIQIVHKGMRDAYDKTHSDYEKKRGIERRFDSGDIDQRSMQALVQTYNQQVKLEKAVKSIHDAAAEAAGLNVLLLPHLQPSFAQAALPSVQPIGHSPVAQQMQRDSMRGRSSPRKRGRGAELGLKR
ncbi:MAG: hypothetical protein V4621_04420 [Pseudomonadota bacterium]